MAKYSLVSNYTIKQFKKNKVKPNEDTTSNIVDRKFNQRKSFEVIVSDITYVNVAGKWHYICLLLDIAGREIIGFS